MKHVDADRASGRQRIQHDAADQRDDAGIENRPRPDSAIDRRFTRQPTLAVDIGIVGDQA